MATVSGNAPGAHNAQVISGDLLVPNDGIEVQGESRFIKITNLTPSDMQSRSDDGAAWGTRPAYSRPTCRAE